jgi:hypothetical protein
VEPKKNRGKELDGLILPHIIKRLNALTRELNLEVVQIKAQRKWLKLPHWEAAALGLLSTCKRGHVLADNDKFLTFLASTLLHS